MHKGFFLFFLGLVLRSTQHQNNLLLEEKKKRNTRRK